MPIVVDAVVNVFLWNWREPSVKPRQQGTYLSMLKGETVVMPCRRHQMMVTRKWYRCCYMQEPMLMPKGGSMAMHGRQHRFMVTRRWWRCSWMREPMLMFKRGP